MQIKIYMVETVVFSSTRKEEEIFNVYKNCI